MVPLRVPTTDLHNADPPVSTQQKPNKDQKESSRGAPPTSNPTWPTTYKSYNFLDAINVEPNLPPPRPPSEPALRDFEDEYETRRGP